MLDVKNMTIDELENHVQSLGEDRYRSSQIARWIYQYRATSFDRMTNLSNKFKEKLRNLYFVSVLTPIKEMSSKDGTHKYLFRLDDGNLIESVLLQEVDHLTLCVSVQVGCGFGCKFCLTGKRGFVRNLNTAEIINQVCSINDSLPKNGRISNLVLMGMGEPLANYDNVLKALRIFTDPNGLQFSTRRVTLSTVGLVPEIRRLGKDIGINLAVSLNAASDNTRDSLMPINRKYPLGELLEACREFPLSPRKRITFEYLLINGINDSIDDAKRLTRVLKGIRCKVNLIPYNEHPGSGFKRPDDGAIDRFQKILINAGYTTTIRTTKGSDILAACGQLGSSSPDY